MRWRLNIRPKAKLCGKKLLSSALNRNQNAIERIFGHFKAIQRIRA